MKPEPAPSVPAVAVLYLMVAGVGLYALPTLLEPGARQGGSPAAPPIAAVIWILAASLLVLLALALSPALNRIVGIVVLRTPWFSTTGSHPLPRATSAWVSFPVVAIVNVALAETILRPAIVALLGGPIEAVPTDSLVAVICLVVLILLLARLQQAAGPWIEAGAWFTLDALIATSNSEGARRFYDTGQQRTRAVITQRGDVISVEATRLAPEAAGGEATVFAGEATIAAPNAGATISAVQKTEPGER